MSARERGEREKWEAKVPWELRGGPLAGGG